MTLQGFVTFLVIGGLAGWITGLISKGRGFGLAGNLVVGIIGAIEHSLLKFAPGAFQLGDGLRAAQQVYAELVVNAKSQGA